MKNIISLEVSGETTIENVLEKEYTTNANAYDFLKKVIEIAKERGYNLDDVHLVFSKDNEKPSNLLDLSIMRFVNIEDKTDYYRVTNFDEE